MSSQSTAARAPVGDYEFDRAVAVTSIGADEFAAQLDEGWTVGAGLNGGYLLAVVGNAVRARLADEALPDPFAVSAHYLAASRPGPATVRTRVLRSGGRHATVAADLVQDQDGEETNRLSVLATYGDLDRSAGPVQTSLAEPQLPPLEDCFAATDGSDDFVRNAPLLRRFGTRLDPRSTGWAVGKPSRRGLIQAWFKLADDRPLDPIALLMAVDALPPTTFDHGLFGWAPTVQLAVHVRARPAPGWVKIRHQTHNMAGGYFEEDCDIWDSTGRVVAQSRQLALVPR